MILLPLSPFSLSPGLSCFLCCPISSKALGLLAQFQPIQVDQVLTVPSIVEEVGPVRVELAEIHIGMIVGLHWIQGEIGWLQRLRAGAGELRAQGFQNLDGSRSGLDLLFVMFHDGQASMPVDFK